MPPENHPAADDDEVVRGAEEIFQILKLLQKRKTQLTILFPGYRHQYVSMVLQAERTIGRFVLDEISPSEGHRLAVSGQPFHIRARLQGAEIAIRNQRSENVGKDNDAAYYVLPFPKEITYIQRRSAFRVGFPEGLHGTIEFRHPETGKTYRGRMLDISGTGCRAEFESLEESAITYKQRLSDCTITVPGTPGIQLDVEIMALSADEEGQTLTCGIRFLGIAASTDRAIFRLVNAIQRKAIHSH